MRRPFRPLRAPTLPASAPAAPFPTERDSAGSITREPRLKTGIWIKALIRRCDLAAVGVAVTARGDPDAGAILVKLDGREAGCTVLAQARAPDGAPVWMRATGAAPVDPEAADAYIARQRQRDPDLWVVEIDRAAADGLIDAPIL